jgi:hypothetical protein
MVELAGTVKGLIGGPQIQRLALDTASLNLSAVAR